MAIIMITGCSTGIGYTLAESLARAGHNVYATMRQPDKTSELRQIAESENLDLHVLPLDVLSDESVKTAVDFVLSKEGYIDVFINNAGISDFGAIEELPIDAFVSDMSTNYFGTVRCVKAVLPSMRQRKSGMIINNSSVAGKMFSNFHSTYCASKAAVEAFSESLGQEVLPFNIKVVVLQPSFLVTPIFSKARHISENTKYPNIKRYASLFGAALEAHESPETAADVVKEIISGKPGTFRRPAGLTAAGFLSFRASMQDEDWINSVAASDDEFIAGMEAMGMPVGKFMRADTIPQINTMLLAANEV